MFELIPRVLGLVGALLFPSAALPYFLLRPGPPPRHARGAPLPEPPRRTGRPRPYVLPRPAVPPDYDRFCEVHARHRARWRLTYESGQAAPFQAHNRVAEGIVLAASDLEALDFALAEFAPPPHVRPYIDRTDGSLLAGATDGGVV